MNLKGLIYSFVAKETLVLAIGIVHSLLGKLQYHCRLMPAKVAFQQHKYTYSCDVHTFNFLIDSGFGYNLHFSDIISSDFIDDLPFDNYNMSLTDCEDKFVQNLCMCYFCLNHPNKIGCELRTKRCYNYSGKQEDNPFFL